ncbi:MAG: hypothetical protein H8D23_27530 [Candidatus Brocadiales bacterium]|nr:hypothetical protein [Candidatus Brocadiales bacterium]
MLDDIDILKEKVRKKVLFSRTHLWISEHTSESGFPNGAFALTHLAWPSAYAPITFLDEAISQIENSDFNPELVNSLLTIKSICQKIKEGVKLSQLEEEYRKLSHELRSTRSRFSYQDSVLEGEPFLAYRGQTYDSLSIDGDILPSFHRIDFPKAKPILDFEDILEIRCDFDNIPAFLYEYFAVLCDITNSINIQLGLPNLNFAGDLQASIFQHYGIRRTNTIDVTFNKNIALWFATHDYVPDPDVNKDDILRNAFFFTYKPFALQDANAVKRSGHYVPLPRDKWGAIYTIELPKYNPIPPYKDGNYYMVTETGGFDSLISRPFRQECASLFPIKWNIYPLPMHMINLADSCKVIVEEVTTLYPKDEYPDVSSLPLGNITDEYLFPDWTEDIYYLWLKHIYGVKVFM